MPLPRGIRFRYERGTRATTTPLSTVSEHSHSSHSLFVDERGTSVGQTTASPQPITNRRRRDKDAPDLSKLELFEPAPADHEHHLPETDGSFFDEDDCDIDDPLAPKKEDIEARKTRFEALRAAKEARRAKREAAIAAAAADKATRRQSSRPLVKDTLGTVRRTVRNKKLQAVLSGAPSRRDRHANANANVALMAARRAPGNRAGRLVTNGMVGVMNSMENGADMEPTEEEREREEGARLV